MPRTTSTQTNFNAGEFSPRMFGRGDLQQYGNAAAEMVNFIPMPQGGVQRRAGYRFVNVAANWNADQGELITSPDNPMPRIIPFQFNTDESYVVELGVLRGEGFAAQIGYARFYQNDVTLKTPVTITGGSGTTIKVGARLNDLVSGAGWVVPRDFVQESGGDTYQVVSLSWDGSDTTLTVSRGVDTDSSPPSSGTLLIPYTIQAPWDTFADFASLGFVQSADILYLTHPEYAPRELRRLSKSATDANWEIIPFPFDNGPYLPVNVTPVVMEPAAKTGASVEVLMGVPILAADTGSDFFEVEGDQQQHVGSGDTVWVNGSTGNDGSYTVDAVSYTASTDRTKIEVTTSVSDGTADGLITLPQITTVESDDSEGASNTVRGRMVRISNPSSGTDWGYGRIVGFTNPGKFDVFVESDFATASQTTTDWQLGGWSGRDGGGGSGRGWPRTATFHQQRLWFGGTDTAPQTLWGSVVGDFSNFTPNKDDGTVRDDDGLVLTLDDDQVNIIRWMRSEVRGLMVGTSTGEFILRSRGAFDPITPTSVAAIRQSSYGSIEGVRPSKAGEAILYWQRGGQRLRQAIFDFNTDRIVSPDLTLLADHVMPKPVIDSDYVSADNPVLWAVGEAIQQFDDFTGDEGSLRSLTYLREQEILSGWARHRIGPATLDFFASEQTIAFRYNSVVVIPESSGGDRVWLACTFVNDSNNAGWTYIGHIDRPVEPSDLSPGITDGLYLDLAVDRTVLTNVNMNVFINGLHHLEGYVDIWVLGDDGTLLTNLEVESDGEISITGIDVGTNVKVGIPYTSRIKTLPAVPPAPFDSHGKLARLHRAFMRVFNSLGGKYRTIDADGEQSQYAIEYADSTALNTQIVDLTAVSGTDRGDLQIEIETNEPFNLSILFLTQEYEVGGV